eukprot:scaffold17729_cov36-Prasinocladus_malaysianus.AAC.3
MPALQVYLVKVSKIASASVLATANPKQEHIDFIWPDILQDIRPSGDWQKAPHAFKWLLALITCFHGTRISR